MAQKPETKYIKRVHGKMTKLVFSVKMANPWVAGIPDVYYEYKNDMFIEYKYSQKPLDTLNLHDPKKKPFLTRHQRDWVYRREANGLLVAVIVGFPEGGIIFDGRSVQEAIDLDITGIQLMADIHVAVWIAQKVGVKFLGKTDDLPEAQFA